MTTQEDEIKDTPDLPQLCKGDEVLFCERLVERPYPYYYDAFLYRLTPINLLEAIILGTTEHQGVKLCVTDKSAGHGLYYRRTWRPLRRIWCVYGFTEKVPSEDSLAWADTDLAYAERHGRQQERRDAAANDEVRGVEMKQRTKFEYRVRDPERMSSAGEVADER